MILGLSAMGPAYSISEDREYIMKDDYLVRFGVFMEDKFCLGASFTLSDYIQDNNIEDNIYLYGLFARMYQKNNAFNTFIEVGGDFGNKNYMINGLSEPIVKQKKAMFGVGITLGLGESVFIKPIQWLVSKTWKWRLYIFRKKWIKHSLFTITQLKSKPILKTNRVSSSS